VRTLALIVVRGLAFSKQNNSAKFCEVRGDVTLNNRNKTTSGSDCFLPILYSASLS
jgi:hypothetical protein